MIFEIAKIERAVAGILSDLRDAPDSDSLRQSVAARCEQVLSECKTLRQEITTPPLLSWKEFTDAVNCDDRR